MIKEESPAFGTYEEVKYGIAEVHRDFEEYAWIRTAMVHGSGNKVVKKYLLDNQAGATSQEL